MLKKIATVVVVLLAALLGYAATRPDTFRVQRATSIDAPPEKIFALVQDFHTWGSWSPWETLDPTMKRTLSGATNGKGAVYEWDGNQNVGKGRMEITEASPPSRVTISLDFMKPFEAHNVAEFTLDAKGTSTNVVWAMHGANNYFTKVIGLFVSMDTMIGDNFETGLANLKTLAEASRR